MNDLLERNKKAVTAFYDLMFNQCRPGEAIETAWSPFFAGADAPFSWEPEFVEVLDSGKLAYSSGPVRDSRGRQVGTFNTIWRRDTKGRWKVVLDKGCPPCESPPPPPTPGNQ